MRSIKEIFLIGHGPSSSHTMGPAKAAEIIKNNYTNANNFEVILYNSLNLTGKGHLTKEAIKTSLAPHNVKFQKLIDEKRHPNTLIIKAFENDVLIIEKEVISVGGGKIKFVGEEETSKQIYPHHTFNEIKAYCKKHKLALADYVFKYEDDDFKDYLLLVWEHMVNAIEKGLKARGTLPGPLKLKRKARMLYNQDSKNELPTITEKRLVTSYAFAVSEENASGNVIVTAPTCGAAGVLPSVLYYAYQTIDYVNEERIKRGLAVAGLIGNLIKHNASISGAVAGCQAEIGSACSMAAAAYATLFSLTIDQVEYAAEIAMEHHLGLTCDPINGYVQIPCIERNAVAALRAMDACGLSYFLMDTRKISFDLVVKTMYQTGLDMHPNYKETAKGGLAAYYEGDEDVNCW